MNMLLTMARQVMLNIHPGICRLATYSFRYKLERFADTPACCCAVRFNFNSGARAPQFKALLLKAISHFSSCLTLLLPAAVHLLLCIFAGAHAPQFMALLVKAMKADAAMLTQLLPAAVHLLLCICCCAYLQVRVRLSSWRCW
jgi:hypothetical protein